MSDGDVRGASVCHGSRDLTGSVPRQNGDGHRRSYASDVADDERRAAGYGGGSVFVTTAYGQGPSILGAPSEANHFIETPKGWVHPKTPWGDPDIQGMWPISLRWAPCRWSDARAAAGQAVRPATRTRRGSLKTNTSSALDAALGRGDRRPAADRAGQLRPRAAVRRHRPDVPPAPDVAHRRSAERPAA